MNKAIYLVAVPIILGILFFAYSQKDNQIILDQGVNISITSVPLFVDSSGFSGSIFVGDRYNNPISGIIFDLNVLPGDDGITSSVVEPLQAKTDSSGKIMFLVTSTDSGKDELKIKSSIQDREKMSGELKRKEFSYNFTSIYP